MNFGRSSLFFVVLLLLCILDTIHCQFGTSILELRCEYESEPVSNIFINGLCYSGYNCSSLEVSKARHDTIVLNSRSRTDDSRFLDLSRYGIVILNSPSCAIISHKKLVNFYKEGGFIISTIKNDQNRDIFKSFVNLVAKEVGLGNIYLDDVIIPNDDDVSTPLLFIQWM